MKKSFVQYIIIVSLIIFAVTGCQDDFMKEGFIDEGKAKVSVTLDFKPMSAALTQTRTAGNALKDITSLHVLWYNEEKSLIKSWEIEEYDLTDKNRTDEDAENKHSAEESTKQAILELPEKIEVGRYYMYAVANIPDLLTNETYAEAIKTIDGLKNIPLVWDPKTITNNKQMIGYCTNTDAPQSEDTPLVIQEKNVNLHAWLRRAASKVTVAFDGSGLKDSVSIYLKALRIKNIPKSCKLGAENKATTKEELIEKGEEVVYSESTSYDESYPALITKHQPLYPKGTKQENEDGTISWKPNPDCHSENNPNSLFFYENMQGEGSDKSAAADGNKDGLQDDPYLQRKEFGTYIEVDAYYESTNPQRPGISEITYRFMLGQDIYKDYNARRNCHYRLTLHFKGFADEPDWRIDYVTKFGVSQPYDVNYQGKYWLPDNVTDNQGNNFYDNNTITIASYRYNTEDAWGKRELLDYTIEYKDSVNEDFPNGEFSSDIPTWLSGQLEDVTDQYPKKKNQDLKVLKINYKNEYKEVNINTLLNDRSNTGITDLASNGTANCYIVDAKGTYTLPLVYGNAVDKDGKTVPSSYTGFSGDSRVLQTFKNYKNEDIQNAYILDDIGRTGSITPCIVWQDSENLISGVSYDAGAYGGKGGLSFSIGNNIAQGNAVIAIKKDNAIVWSWHIWVTSKELTDRIWTIKNYWYNTKYDVMPVNLGWCSGPNEKIRYYGRHKCQVRFRQILSKNTNDTNNYGSEQIVTIIQEPHISLPRGNNTYYQWGRKDPLVGTDASYANKTWWCTNGTSLEQRTTQPDFLNQLHFMTIVENGVKKIVNNPDGIDPNSRPTSMVSLERMIQNPQKLNNPRRKGFYIGDKSTDENGDEIFIKSNKGEIDDEIYSNLWLDDMKTIYDPCPPGYKVAPLSAFTAFTTTDWATGDIALHGNNASQNNMLTEYKEGNMEFYVDGKRKLMSVTFPLSGYRDYDAGEVYHVGLHLYVWEARNFKSDNANPEEKLYQENNYSNFLKAYFMEKADATGNNTGYIGVNLWESFYATDACSVRPVKE